MNKTKRGRVPIKKPTSKKFSTRGKMIFKKKKHRRNWDLEVPSIFIYCEESHIGRKGDKKVAIRRERVWGEISVKP